MVRSTLAVLALVAGASSVVAIGTPAAHLRYARQTPSAASSRPHRSHSSSAAGPAATNPGSGGAGVGGAGTIQTGTNPPIAASMPTQPTSPLPTTYPAGATAPIAGAPALPTSGLNIAKYPALDQIPPLDSAQMKTWLSQLDLSNVPDINPTGEGGCANASNAAAVANSGSSGSCWWTCGGCTREDDITTCPDKGTWGTSFDDGPSPDTPRLLEYLDAHKLKTTFFVVGSRVLSRPDMLQYEYMSGHQISVHTWSHHALTTLTNEEIVAELMWTKQVIYDTLGVTPNTMRPPYGDIDDRVRAIAKACGLTPIIWTSAGGQTYDTQDWQIAAGTVTPAKVLANFQGIIGNYTQLDTGFIVLAHDLYQQSVDLAIEFVLPDALTRPGLTLEPIITCLGDPMSEAYIETASDSDSGNSTNPSPSANGTAASGNGTSTAGKSSASGTSNSSNTTSTQGTTSGARSSSFSAAAVWGSTMALLGVVSLLF